MEKHFIYQSLFLICILGSIICDDGGTHSKHVFSYEGSGDAKLACNGSDVINITNIKLTNHPTDCPRDTCNLTDSDKNHIESCNGNSACTIPIDEMSPCIKDKGFYNVDYSCQRNVFSCDFEADNCDWFFEQNDWTIDNTVDQYLYKDHTTGSGEGHFMYVKIDDDLDLYTGFRSKLIYGNTKQCLTFYFFIRGTDDSIMLYIQHINGTNIQEVNITRPADGNMWNRMRILITDVPGYRVIIEERGKYVGSVFAVDDISISNRDCEEIRECDFETGECDWSRSNHWYRVQGTPTNSQTGPLTDHTTIDSGYYVYMEASAMSNRQRTSFTSPTYNDIGEMCFTFWYYMYGSQMGSLRVFIKSNGDRSRLFLKSFNQGQRWHFASIDLRVNGEFKMIIEGQRGWGHKSGIAIDDISVLPGNCKGIVQHQQACTSVDDEVLLNKCSNHYLSNMHVNVDPSKDSCKDFLDKNANSICNNSSQAVLCDVRNVTRKRPSCFNLNNLVIQYTCAEKTVDQTTTTTKTINESEEAVTTDEKKVTATNKPTVSETRTTHGHTGSRITNESDETGMVVGFIIGGLLVIGLICTVAFVVYRRRNGYQKGKTEKGNNNLSASWHVDGQGAYMNSVQLSTKTVATGSVKSNNLATNNPSYEQGYIITSANKSFNKDESEYMNMPKQTALTGGHNTTSEYNVLDPKETGFYRTSGNTYELASPTNENSDDEYAESGVGVYDISGNSRHKEKDTIYDHSVDDTYDTSNRGRQEDLGDYTYNHVFGKQTEDDYDIAGS